jgi:hypothetical protein
MGMFQYSVPTYFPLIVTLLIPLSLEAEPLNRTFPLVKSGSSIGSIFISGEVSEDF